MLIVLERLSPAERAAFVLHDVFQFSFDEVANIVDRTPAAVRQLASRARKHVQAEVDPVRFEVDPAEVQRISEQFVTAATNGDVDALMQVLDPNVVGHEDTGGFVPGPHTLFAGREVIANQFLRFVRGLQITLVPIAVNGEPGALLFRDRKLHAVAALSVREGLITHIHAIANPYKLAYVMSILDESSPTGAPGSKDQRVPRAE
jgi:RNA polymerase sigma-70 factor (ECF subfamily)